MVSSSQKLPLFPGLGTVARFCSLLWWQHTIAFSWLFKRYLLVPAILFILSAGLTVPAVNTLTAFNSMGDQVQEAGPFITKMLLVWGALAISGILSIVAMAISVFKLAAFSRAFLLYPLPTGAAEMKGEQYKNLIQQYQKEAATEIARHKGYLTKSWLLAALIMLPLIIVFALSSFSCVVLTMPDTSAITIPAETRRMIFIPQILAAISLLIMSNYSVVTMAVTCMNNLSVGAATKRSLLLSITTSPLLSAVSIAAMILVTLITTPYVVASMVQPSVQWMTPGSLPQALAWEFWQVLAGMIMYPLSTALLCEVVRDCIDRTTNNTISQNPASPPTAAITATDSVLESSVVSPSLLVSENDAS